MRVVGATSQLDLPSLTPLSVVGCGQLQLEVPHWAATVDCYTYLITYPTFCGSRFSTGRLLTIEDFYLLPLAAESINIKLHAWKQTDEGE